VGDAVINSQGRWSSVIGVYPQGNKEIYRVTFTDGSSTECCADHLWLTQKHWERSEKRPGSVKPLHQIREERASKQENNHFIPMVKPVEFAQMPPLPLDPYLLGILLGDGCFLAKSVYLSNPERELHMQVRRLLPAGVELRPLGESTLNFGIRRMKASAPHPVMAALRELGLVGKKSVEKFIPDRYKFGSVSTRVSVLNGVLDTDGYTNEYSLEYSTSSPHLAQDVQFLVESLGGKPMWASGSHTIPIGESTARVPDPIGSISACHQRFLRSACNAKRAGISRAVGICLRGPSSGLSLSVSRKRSALRSMRLTSSTLLITAF
jgi:hypothetical protein